MIMKFAPKDPAPKQKKATPTTFDGMVKKAKSPGQRMIKGAQEAVEAIKDPASSKAKVMISLRISPALHAALPDDWRAQLEAMMTERWLPK
jgi:hypothetical protein